MTIPRFQKLVLHWYKTHRRSLPWRNKKDSYKILVSEVMLQQTQVSRVLPKYKEFLKAFPNLLSLARARDTRLLKAWQGLGYWRRAKYLKEIAKILCTARITNFRASPRRQFGTVPESARDKLPRAQNPKSCRDFEVRSQENSFPSNPEFLETLPGIGHYTARAIACFAFGNTEAFLDTNIRRVYLHFFFPNRQNVPDSKILPIAQKAVWLKNPKEWHYALFDYGALVLKNKKINKQSRHYRKQSRFEGSFRSFRTKVVHFLLSKQNSKTTQKTLETFLQKQLVREKSTYTAHEIISSLLKDKLIKSAKTYYFL